MAEGQHHEGGGDHGEHRGHATLQNVLQYAIQNTPNNDDASIQTTEQERQQWLSSALSQITKDPTDILKCHINSLKGNLSGGTNKDICSDLEELSNACCQIDMAIDFYKFGGFHLLKQLFANDDPDVKWRSLELFADVVQNNPPCQKAAVDADLLPDVLNLLDNDNNIQVRIKSLYALSGLVGESQEALAVFHKHDGISSVMRAIQSGHEKLEVKGAILLSRVCNDENEKEVLQKMGVVSQLVLLVDRDLQQHHEHIMQTLVKLVRDCPPAIEECQNPRLAFKDFLQTRIEQTTDKPEHDEQRQYCEELLQTCFPEGTLSLATDDVNR